MFEDGKEIAKGVKNDKDVIEISEKYKSIGFLADFLANTNPLGVKSIVSSHVQLNQHIEVSDNQIYKMVGHGRDNQKDCSWTRAGFPDCLWAEDVRSAKGHERP